MQVTKNFSIDKYIVDGGPEEFKPFFKTVTVKGERRALRLEKSYWTALKLICQKEQTSLPAIIAEVESSHLFGNNLASAVRQFVLVWHSHESRDIAYLKSGSPIQSFLTASPTPAFALTEDKKIKASNALFLKYLRRNFFNVDVANSKNSMMLNLNIKTQKLIEALIENNNHPIALSFSIKMFEREIKGIVNTILAPTTDEKIIICYVV